MADEKKQEAVKTDLKTNTEDAESSIDKDWLDKAAQGSQEYQLKVGQEYLKLADSSVGREENGTQAVFWLSQASKQGNDEATAALKECLENKTGITDDNREDVKWCVSTTGLEKKIRFAAKNMFKSINTAHKDVLSKEEYTDAIKKLTGGKEQKLLLAAGKRIGEQISENEFVKLLSRKVQGTTTLTSTEQSDAYQTAGPLEKVFKYPRETAMVVGDKALEFASNDGLGMVVSCIPVDQIYFLLLFFVYGFLNPVILLFVIPLVVFYISFAAMVVTTLQMFYKKKKLKEANALAEMLKQYDTAVDVEQTQSQYSWNSLTPYLVYFMSVPIVVMSFSLADKTYIPCSEFCILSAVLCGITFVALSDSHDLITLLALVSNFLAALPVFFNNFPDVPVITSLIHLFSSSFVSIELFGGIQLNIGIGSVCYCLIPILFIQMACRKSFQGMYRVLVPHLVCYFWFSMITSMYKFSSWLGLARATVGYIMLPVLIPLSAFLFIIFLIYVFVKLMSSDLFGKVVVTMLLACIPILLTQTKKLTRGKFDKYDKKFATLKKIVMGLFAVLAIIPLIFVRLPTTSKKVVANLALPDYVGMCGPGDDPDLAAYQITCHGLKGTKVAWNGVFKHAKLTAVSNDITGMIEVFPSFIGNPLRCFYGTEYGDCEDEELSDSDKAYCKMMTGLGHECHTRDHDKFTFNFVVDVVEGDQTLSLSVDAGHGFKATIVALEPGDEVQIKGTLVDGLGTSSPKLKLKEVTCTSRELAVMKMVEQDNEDLYYDLFQQSFQVAFNFFWHPLLEFVPTPASPAMEMAAETE